MQTLEVAKRDKSHSGRIYIEFRSNLYQIHIELSIADLFYNEGRVKKKIGNDQRKRKKNLEVRGKVRIFAS